MSNTIQVEAEDGNVRIRIDNPGERALSVLFTPEEANAFYDDLGALLEALDGGV